jgi:D-methionine transport system substrate-binding protein
VAIPNNVTNEYRALRILEQNGFIKLDEETHFSLAATVADIVEYVRPIQIIELDEFQVIPTREEFDFYIINTNKILEAGITPNKLFSEGPDSPYANIVVVRAEDAENPYILALVDALKSNETKAFIREKYGDAVVPVE